MDLKSEILNHIPNRHGNLSATLVFPKKFSKISLSNLTD